jgi:hypothetical protein
LISLREVDERHSLNGWLAGLSAQEYEATVRQSKYSPDTYGRAELQQAAMLTRRMALFERLADDYPKMVRLYMPTHVLLAAGKQPNPLLKWNLVASTNGLNLYKLDRDATAAVAF